jgi:(2S)-methylsuccinyl-CoA dehydrogenase
MDASALAEQIGAAVGLVIERASSELAIACAPSGQLDSELVDSNSPLLYELATISSGLAAGQGLIAEDKDGHLALVHLARIASEALGRLAGRASLEPLEAAVDALAAARSTTVTDIIVEAAYVDAQMGVVKLSEELEFARESFRRFAEDRVAPIAEGIHRADLDVPESIITELAALGCFGLSIPSEFGGFADGGPDELLGMLIATEELSRGSLGVAGSLITRSEIVAAALVRGGTAEQRARLLPAIASGEMMAAVAVTEPDAGSDVARLRVTARRVGDGWVIDGVKTWCTFAGRADAILVLARTDSDPRSGHKGLSLFVVEKPRAEGHDFDFRQPGGGRMSGRAIPTLGYRGMHSFEVSFEGWTVGHEALIGGDDGLGRGFYLQMQAFANARLQTAARAQGVMQAAIDDALSYSAARKVFGRPLADHSLTKERLAGMVATLAACRAATRSVARAIAAEQPDAAAAASKVKLYACRSAEWVTREAQQLHGGYGYAEEYRVSRLFVDARVLSIFEGTEEVLALKVVGRDLLNGALKQR